MTNSIKNSLAPQCLQTTFGNKNRALVGDFAQLPPVGNTPLCTLHQQQQQPTMELLGVTAALSSYRLFLRKVFAFRLSTDKRRLIRADEISRPFSAMSQNGSLSEEEWVMLNIRAKHNLSPTGQHLFHTPPGMTLSISTWLNCRDSKPTLRTHPCLS